jgi:hypothetical protein
MSFEQFTEVTGRLGLYWLVLIEVVYSVNYV